MALTFRFLGTASGLPEVDRFGQTTVVTNDAPGGRIEHVLLDAGDGAASLLMRHRYDLLAIRSIAISHMHGDHHGGFVQVVKTMMHLNRSDDLVVLAPDEGIEGLRHYLELSYLIEEMLGFHIDWVPLSQCGDDPIEIASDISLTAFSNNHLRHARERLAGRTDLPRSYSFESYSFVLEHPEHRIVFSGNLDGARGAQEMAPHLDPCDLLICELAHVDPEHLGELLANHDVRSVALAHFHPKWNDTSPTEIRALMERNASGLLSRVDVFITEDGDEIKLADSPSIASH